MHHDRWRLRRAKSRIALYCCSELPSNMDRHRHAGRADQDRIDDFNGHTDILDGLRHGASQLGLFRWVTK